MFGVQSPGYHYGDAQQHLPTSSGKRKSKVMLQPLSMPSAPKSPMAYNGLPRQSLKSPNAKLLGTKQHFDYLLKGSGTQRRATHPPATVPKKLSTRVGASVTSPNARGKVGHVGRSLSQNSSPITATREKETVSRFSQGSNRGPISPKLIAHAHVRTTSNANQPPRTQQRVTSKIVKVFRSSSTTNAKIDKIRISPIEKEKRDPKVRSPLHKGKQRESIHPPPDVLSLDPKRHSAQSAHSVLSTLRAITVATSASLQSMHHPSSLSRSESVGAAIDMPTSNPPRRLSKLNVTPQLTAAATATTVMPTLQLPPQADGRPKAVAKATAVIDAGQKERSSSTSKVVDAPKPLEAQMTAATAAAAKVVEASDVTHLKSTVVEPPKNESTAAISTAVMLTLQLPLKAEGPPKAVSDINTVMNVGPKELSASVSKAVESPKQSATSKLASVAANVVVVSDATLQKSIAVGPPIDGRVAATAITMADTVKPPSLTLIVPGDIPIATDPAKPMSMFTSQLVATLERVTTSPSVSKVRKSKLGAINEQEKSKEGNATATVFIPSDDDASPTSVSSKESVAGTPTNRVTAVFYKLSNGSKIGFYVAVATPNIDEETASAINDTVEVPTVKVSEAASGNNVTSKAAAVEDEPLSADGVMYMPFQSEVRQVAINSICCPLGAFSVTQATTFWDRVYQILTQRHVRYCNVQLNSIPEITLNVFSPDGNDAYTPVISCSSSGIFQVFAWNNQGWCEYRDVVNPNVPYSLQNEFGYDEVRKWERYSDHISKALAELNFVESNFLIFRVIRVSNTVPSNSKFEYQTYSFPNQMEPEANSNFSQPGEWVIVDAFLLKVKAHAKTLKSKLPTTKPANNAASATATATATTAANVVNK